MTQNLPANDWQSKNKSFADKCSYIFEKKLMTDCEFQVDTEKFPCHRVILGMASPVFQAMFFSGYNDEINPIPIPDIKPDIFLQMLQFIYQMKIKIQSPINACELYYAAKKYMLPQLEKECTDYLLSNLNHSNCLYLYEFSKFHDENKLRKQCILEIQLHTTEVLNSIQVYNMSEDTFSSILEFNTLNVSSEMVLFKTLEYWASSNIESKEFTSTQSRTKLWGLLKKIRFLSLTKKEFVEGIVPSKLLTDKEKLDILLRISEAVDSQMDNGLCLIKQKRRPLNIKSTSVLDIQDVNEVRCDGSEWLTSLFTVNSPMDLMGIEVRMQSNIEDGEYVENIMVKVAEAQSKFHFAEGNIRGSVQYNSKAQILFNRVAKLKPGKEYALHVFLCRPGMYPVGRHHITPGESDESVIVDFISHSSWQGAHPFNTTVLSSIIYTDPMDDDDEELTNVQHPACV